MPAFDWNDVKRSVTRAFYHHLVHGNAKDAMQALSYLNWLEEAKEILEARQADIQYWLTIEENDAPDATRCANGVSPEALSHQI